MSNSRPRKKTKLQETKFEKICRLLREQNAAEIKKLDDKYWYYKEDENGDTAMRLLAREGSVEAVWFMIDNFHKTADEAVLGYAEAGLIERVNELLDTKRLNDFPTWKEYEEYRASAPYVHEGSKAAIQGYAFAGLDAEVEKILKEYPEYLDDALHGHLEARRWSKIHEFIARGAKIQDEHIPGKIRENKNEVNHLLCLMNSAKDRMKLLGVDDEPNEKQTIRLKNASNMHRIMNEYHLTYEQTQAMYAQIKGKPQGVRTWLLQGMQVAIPLPPKKNEDGEDEVEEVNNPLPLFPKELYLHISTFVLGLSLDDTKNVLQGVHANLFENVVKHHAGKFTQGLFGTPKYFAETANAMEQYENRCRRARIDR